MRWQKSTIYIAVQTSPNTPEPVDFEIRMREYMPVDTYSETLKAQNLLFWDALEGTDAHATSFRERQDADDHDDTEFTYGEVALPSFIPLLALAEP